MFRVGLIIVVCLFLSSCFEFVEQLKLNEDGSGSMKLIMNMSQSKTKLKSVMLMDKVNGHKVPSQQDITNQINSVASIAKGVKGISNVKASQDFDNFIMTFSFDFKSVEDINAMVYEVRKAKQKKVTPQKVVLFSYGNDKKLNRSFDFKWLKDFSKLKPEDQDVFKDATYASIYRFDKSIKKVSNSSSKVSPSKKATMLRLNMGDVIKQKETLKNTVSL